MSGLRFFFFFNVPSYCKHSEEGVRIIKPQNIDQAIVQVMELL